MEGLSYVLILMDYLIGRPAQLNGADICVNGIAYETETVGCIIRFGSTHGNRAREAQCNVGVRSPYRNVVRGDG